MRNESLSKSLYLITLVLLLAFASLLSFFTIIRAAPQQNDPWENMGIYGGSTTSIAFDPSLNRFYLTIHSSPGLYVSEDDGDTWLMTEAQFDFGGKILLGSDGALYAHFDTELMRSDNNSDTWETIATGEELSGNDIPDFDVEKYDPEHILVTRKGGSNEQSYIYYTEDGGDTWITSTVSVSGTTYFVGVRFDPSDTSGQKAYAINSRKWENFNIPSYVHQSINGGISFTQVFTAPMEEQFFSVGANISGTIYARTNKAVYRSSDGIQWTQVLSASNSVSFISFSPHDPRIVYTDGYMSPDDGTTWVPTETYAFWNQSSLNANLMFTGYPGGVKRSLNGGTTWAVENNGINGVVVLDAVIDPHDSQIFYVGSESGMGRSFDGGDTWEFPFSGINETIYAFDFDTNDTSTFYGSALGGVFKFTDYGASRTKINVGAGDYSEPLEFFDVAVDPTNSEIVYLAGIGYDSNLDTGVGGFYRSEDSGQTWLTSTLENIPVNAIATAETITGSIIYAGVGDYAGYSDTAGGVLKSVDQGQQWQQAGLSEKIISAIVIDPTNPDLLFAGTVREDFLPGEEHPVYRSLDGGINWSQLSLVTCGNVSAITIDPNNTNVVYVASCSKLYKSTDGGNNWIDFYDGNASIYSIFVPLLPPLPTEDFQAEASVNQVQLSWSNPPDVDFAGTHIRYLTDTLPTAHMMGISLTIQPNSPGSMDNFTHTGVIPGATYYYAAFAYDNNGNYAKPAWISTTIPSNGLMTSIPEFMDAVNEDIPRKSQVFIATSLGLYRRVEGEEIFLIYLPMVINE